MATISVTITKDTEVGIVAGLSGQTVAQWIQARVTELEGNCVAQVRNLRAKEVADKVSLYDRLPEKDRADVDVIFAKAQAAKEAEEAAKVEEPVVEVKEG
jgi:succinyl-CoA synthetase alpha subunit